MAAIGIDGGAENEGRFNRLFACPDELELREDRAARDILSYVIQAWLGPQGNLAPYGVHLTASDAFTEAITRLHRRLPP